MRVGGKIYIKANGLQYRAKGSWTYNLGRDKKEYVVGSDGPHGLKVMPQIGSISGIITDSQNLSMTDLVDLENATIILELANGKIISLSEASFTGDGNASTEEGEIETEFQGIAEEIRA